MFQEAFKWYSIKLNQLKASATHASVKSLRYSILTLRKTNAFFNKMLIEIKILQLLLDFFWSLNMKIV